MEYEAMFATRTQPAGARAAGVAEVGDDAQPSCAAEVGRRREAGSIW
jgi:hypothetical protein